MKKMEDIMELLTEEFASFEQSVKKLELLSKNLDNLKVKADTSAINYKIEDFLNHQKRRDSFQEKNIETIHKKIDKARMVPKWLTIIFYMGVSLLLITMLYFGYQGFRFSQAKDAAFKNGQASVLNHFDSYFEENPKQFKIYKDWKSKISKSIKE